MRLVLDDLTAAYGSARRYLTEQVGLGEPVLEQLRSRLLSCNSRHIHRNYTGDSGAVLTMVRLAEVVLIGSTGRVQSEEVRPCTQQ